MRSHDPDAHAAGFFRTDMPIMQREHRALRDDEKDALRSVALRPPYMHNASVATLHDVVKHYEKGGIDRPSRSPLMMPILLTEQDRRDLVAFIETLTGPANTAEKGGETAHPVRP